MQQVSRTAAGLFLSGLIALPLTAQSHTISGWVTDALSGDALPGCEVIVERGRNRLARVFTDSAGHFSLSLEGPHGASAAVLRVRRIGYQMDVRKVTSDVSAAGDSLHIALERSAVALAGVVVHATRMERKLRSAGFYQRANTGFGHFLTEEDIEARNPRLVTDALRGVPGVTVAPSARRPGANQVYVARAQGRLNGPRVCLPKVFVDGVVTGTDFDDFLDPYDIVGIEVYRGPAEMPAQFGGAESDCGVIVIWTK